MADFNEQLPEWQEGGIEPPNSKKVAGWAVNDKPPAGWLNWLFNRTYKVLAEIRSVISSHKADTSVHVTAAKQVAWDAKETTAGAQAKADNAQAAAALDATTKANAARDAATLAADAAADAAEAAAKAASIPTTQKGAAGGVADLDANVKVPRDKTYNSLGGRGGITNLDTAFTAGIWTISPGAISSPDGTAYGILENIVSNAEVHNNSTNWIIQVVRMLDARVFSRIKVNQGVWGTWNLEGGEGVFKTKGIVGTDYNEYIHPGTYQIYGNIPANAPPLTAPWGILNVYMGSNGYIVQEATQTTAPYGKWYRTRTETEWGPWLNVAVQNRAVIFDGVDARSAENFRLATDAPSTYPGGEIVFFVNNSPGWPAVYGTVVSVRGNDRVGATAVTQYFYPYNISAPIKYRQALYGSDTWGEWKTNLTNSDAAGFAKTVGIQNFGNSAGPISTAQFVDTLAGLGAFSNEGYWSGRGNWSYAANKYIADSGFGNIPLAGAFIEVIGASSYHTIRVTTATTSDVPNAATSSEFIYVNNGPTYSPGWRKSWNSANDANLMTARDLPSTNLNDAIVPGTYLLAANNAYTNGSGLDWCLMNVYRNTAGYVVQEAVQVTGQNRRYRTRSENTAAWTEWMIVITAPVSTGKAWQIANNRQVVKSAYLSTTSAQTIATYTTGATTTAVTVKVSLITDALRTVAISISYIDSLGNARTYTVLPATQMAANDYQFISPTFICRNASTISVIGQTPSAGGNAWVSAVITEEG
ncbi:pyocin knob domain-containing protein [Paenibacillus sp. sgz500992]|uniref:pyocin knob domain-containing protein n=1 Tax=Paenibacillus sp. sgz500992 TaxID=3242476 RepID=UPI0036D23B4C